MGWFDFLSGKKPTNIEVVPDRIWMTTEAKYAGMAKEVIERASSDTMAILLVAHFPDVLLRLEQLAAELDVQVPLQAVLANQLNTGLAQQLKLDESTVLDVIVGERHPMPSVDDRLEAFADELPCRCWFSHHVSLEDPIMKAFAGPWVQKILHDLGMEEGEAIQSAMVSRRIRKAQEKLETTRVGTTHAESASQWIAMNCPEAASDK